MSALLCFHDMEIYGRATAVLPGISPEFPKIIPIIMWIPMTELIFDIHDLEMYEQSYSLSKTVQKYKMRHEINHDMDISYIT